MKFIATGLEGLILIEPAVHRDGRGYFAETCSVRDLERAGLGAGFVQDNQSGSVYGVIRGLHCQLGSRAQAKLVRALAGTVLDVAVDVRPASPTRGRWEAFELSGDNFRQLYIPRGFLHGFAVLSPSAVVCYKVDAYYCPEASFCVSWADPELNIDWRLPADRIILSEQDRRGHSLSELRLRIASG